MNEIYVTNICGALVRLVTSVETKCTQGCHIVPKKA